jgi:DNA polymerase-3 subunit chi
MVEAPCEVWFYHLERSTLDQVLPELLEKTLARGWRALVRGAAPERLEHLDSWLWTWRDDSFLAHGLDGEGNEALQPVLLTAGQENRNGARALFLIDEAEPGDISAFERCVLIFDGGDDSALATARRRWSAFKAEGRPVTYWRQGESRGWERQG